MFSKVQQALDSLGEALEDVEEAPTPELRRVLGVAKRLRSRMDLLETRTASVVAGRECHGDGGVGLLNQMAGRSRSEAARNVRVDAGLAGIRAARDALGDGEMSLANAARLAQVARKTGADAVAGDPGLVEMAKALPEDEFAQAAQRWTIRRQSSDDLEAQERRNRRNRHVRFWNGDDGAVHMRGSFDAEMGARIQQRLRYEAEQLRQADRRRRQHMQRHQGAGDPAPPDVARTRDQRMADALAALAATTTSSSGTNADAAPGADTAENAHGANGTGTAGEGDRTGGIAPPGDSPGRGRSAGSGQAQSGAGPSSDAHAAGDEAAGLADEASTAGPGAGGGGRAPDLGLGLPPPADAGPTAGKCSCGPAAARHKTAEIIVRADLAAILDNPGGFAELCGIGPIPNRTLGRLACNADVWVEILGEDQLTPLYETVPSRAPTASQRRALIARDRDCVGCGAPPAECEAHHIIAVQHRGKTRLDNLVLVCFKCHDLIHDHDWQVVVRDGRYGLAPPDPQRPAAPAPQRKPEQRTPPRRPAGTRPNTDNPPPHTPTAAEPLWDSPAA